MVDYCKHGYSKAQLKARLCVDCDRAKYEATLTTLRAQLAEATRRAEAAEGERDTLREEVGILRTCVSTHLHGTPQELANAYAALRRLDERRRTATLDPKGGK